MKGEEIIADSAMREVPIGKGLAGALKFQRERGNLRESVEWAGRNMDKKKIKGDEIYVDGLKEIIIERKDEHGRILTPKEEFRRLSYKFHGKGPGKRKQEKRMKQHKTEMKVKQMAYSDTPTHSVERMRELQIQQKSPYLVLSKPVTPGQISDPMSGFATDEEFSGGLTPVLRFEKAEDFLCKRKPGHDFTGGKKKLKT